MYILLFLVNLAQDKHQHNSMFEHQIGSKLAYVKSRRGTLVPFFVDKQRMFFHNQWGKGKYTHSLS